MEKFISLLHLEKYLDPWGTKLTVSLRTSYYVKSLVNFRDLLYGQKENFFLQDQRGKLGAGKRGWAYFAHSGSQSQCIIRFVLPACGFGHLKNQPLWDSWGIFYPEKCMVGGLNNSCIRLYCLIQGLDFFPLLW